MSIDMQTWELKGRFIEVDETDDEWGERCERDEEDYHGYPESCINGGMYSPADEYCNHLCPIGPCMTIDEWGEMMEHEARHDQYMDRMDSTGWRGKFWRAWYWLLDIRLRLPQLPTLETCEVCGRRYWNHRTYWLYPTCSELCHGQWLPF